MLLKSTAAKAGVAGTVITGSGATGVYLTRDLINYYEVERKIMNGDGILEVESSDSDWKIKTKDGGDWNSNNGYYWECVISGTTTPALSKVNFEARISSAFKLDTKEARQRLVYLCSNDRGQEPNSKQIKSKFKAPSNLTTKNELLDHLFGPSILKQVEREVIEKDLKLTITVPTDGNNKKITITAPTSATGNDPKLDEGREWSCEIDVSTTSTSLDTFWKTKLEANLFHSVSTESITENQKLNKGLLIKACSQHRDSSKNTDKSVKGIIKAKEDTSSPKKLSFENPDLNVLLQEKPAPAA